MNKIVPWVVAGAAISVFIVGLIALMMMQESVLNQTSIPVQNSTSSKTVAPLTQSLIKMASTSADLVLSETYKNTVLGFEMKYPKSFINYPVVIDSKTGDLTFGKDAGISNTEKYDLGSLSFGLSQFASSDEWERVQAPGRNEQASNAVCKSQASARLLIAVCERALCDPASGVGYVSRTYFFPTAEGGIEITALDATDQNEKFNNAVEQIIFSIEFVYTKEQLFGKDWKTYRNKNFKFEVSIPSYWTIKESANFVNFHGSRRELDLQDEYIYILDLGGTTSPRSLENETFVAGDFDQNSRGTTTLQFLADASWRTFKDGEFEGYQAKFAPSVDETGPVIMIQKGGKIFILTGWLAMDDFIQTFKFVK